MNILNPNIFHYLTNIAFSFYIFQYIYPGYIPIYLNYYLSLFILIGGQINYWTKYRELYKNTKYESLMVIYELIFHIAPFIYFSRYPPKTSNEYIISAIFTLIIFKIYRNIIDIRIYNDPIKYILTGEK